MADDESPPLCDGRAHNSCDVSLPATSTAIAQSAASSQAISEVAADYHNDRTARKCTARNGPDELAQIERRRFVHECLDTVPRDVARAQVALEDGDDGYAFLHLQRVVLAVKEAARTFNEVRRDDGGAA